MSNIYICTHITCKNTLHKPSKTEKKLHACRHRTGNHLFTSPQLISELCHTDGELSHQSWPAEADTGPHTERAMTMWLQRANDRHRSLGEGRGRGNGHTTSIYTCLPNATVMRENTCVHAEVTWWMTGGDGQVDKVAGWNERWGFGYRWSVPLVLPQRRGERRRGQLALKKDRQMKAIAAPTTHCTPVWVWVCVWENVCEKCPSVWFGEYLLGLLQEGRLIAHLSFCQLRALQHMVRVRRSHTLFCSRRLEDG